MKALMLYRPNSENSREAEDYVKDFSRLRGETIELINLDTVDGARKAELYDLPRQPSLIVARDDGQLVASWSDVPFPLMNEVAAYLNS